ncbi:MAG: hypothetical protein JWM33_998 [Caulobacteraceae bacterium]|nr:hypothetical protein [Caulobacteraceae bacterium]
MARPDLTDPRQGQDAPRPPQDLAQMVDVTIEGEWFASLRVEIDPPAGQAGENQYVAQAQVDLAEQGYVLDNEVTYQVRDPEPGEATAFAPDA